MRNNKSELKFIQQQNNLRKSREARKTYYKINTTREGGMNDESQHKRAKNKNIKLICLYSPI